MPTGTPALFLDRDGVVNVDAGYTHRRDEFTFMPGLFELGRQAVDAGLAVVVITNQAGIARGYYDEPALFDLSRWMVDRLEAEGVPVARVYYCPHHEEATDPRYRLACPCRKPQPGMLLAAARELGVDLQRSVLVGDKASDVQAGQSAGVARLALLGDDPLPTGLPAVVRGATLAGLMQALFPDH